MIEVEGMSSGYVEVCKRVLADGDEVSPRGQRTRELLGQTIRIANPADSLPNPTCGREPRYAIAAAEALQLIAGQSYPRMMSSISKTFAEFQTDGTFHGAYGPRTAGQMERVVERLRNDLDTRQAVVTIWDPAYDSHAGELDYPCTLSLHFMVRDGRVILHTTMRSNDVWWGLAYDVFQFTQLQIAVGNAIGRPVGAYYHHANSLHAYERDWEKIERLGDGSTSVTPALRHGVSQPGRGWAPVQARARHLLMEDFPLEDESPTEAWLFNQVKDLDR